MKKFNFTTETFDAWNPGNVTQFYTSEKVIIGWIKLTDQTNTPSNQVMAKSKPIENKLKPTPTIPKESKPKTAERSLFQSKHKTATPTKTDSAKQPTISKQLNTGWNQTKQATNQSLKQVNRFFTKLGRDIGNTFKKKDKSTSNQTAKVAQPAAKPSTQVSSTKPVQTKQETSKVTKDSVNVTKASLWNSTKPTLKERWNRLVNGKEPVREKSYSEPLFKKKTSTNSNAITKSQPKPAGNTTKQPSTVDVNKTTSKSGTENANTTSTKDSLSVTTSTVIDSPKSTFGTKVKRQWNDFVKTTENTFSALKKSIRRQGTKSNRTVVQTNPTTTVVKTNNTPAVRPTQTTTKPAAPVTNKPTKPANTVKKQSIPTIKKQALVTQTERKDTAVVASSSVLNTTMEKPIVSKEIDEKDTLVVNPDENIVVPPLPKTVKKVDNSKPLPKSTVAASNTSNNTNTTASNKNTTATVKPEAKPEVIKEEEAVEPLSHIAGGKAFTFFSGPRGGKYYVVTNVAKRVQQVKITNTGNGKFVRAEVLGPLPVDDLSKGLILKIGDNTKSSLGINGTNFNVKVNY